MERKLALLLCFLLMTTLSVGQDGKLPAFETATITAAVGAKIQPRGQIRNGEFRASNNTLRMLLSAAWDITYDKTIAGAPIWFDRDRFDVTATAPKGTADATVRLMLQAFLVDHFKLVVHQEDRLTDIYRLTVKDGGSKLNRSVESATPACQNGNSGEDATSRECRHVTMTEFANILPRTAIAYIDRAVIDSTGLTGAFDFDLIWTPYNKLTGLNGTASATELTIFGALERQTGLRLQAVSQTMTVLVINNPGHR